MILKYVRFILFLLFEIDRYIFLLCYWLFFERTNQTEKDKCICKHWQNSKKSEILITQKFKVLRHHVSMSIHENTIVVITTRRSKHMICSVVSECQSLFLLKFFSDVSDQQYTFNRSLRWRSTFKSIWNSSLFNVIRHFSW